VRRWVPLLAVMVVAGCGSPGGDLTDGWAPPPSPVAFRPVAGTCYDHVATTVGLADRASYACSELHATEAYYVGTLTGAAARADAAGQPGLSPGAAAQPTTAAQPGAVAPPGAVNGSPAQQAAGLECVRRTAAFIGGDFRAAALTVRPVLPTPRAWAAGARWFRCDIMQIELGGDAPISRRGSLRGALTGRAAAELTLTCFDPVSLGARIERMTPVRCARRHHAEYAGQWAPKRPTAAMLRDDKQAGRGCNGVIARYAGVPDDGNLRYRTGWISFSPTPDDWNAGIRDVRCFLWLDDIAVTGSYRGAGPAKLTINYE
jgi:hypothetical protein